jgi:16S rRNA (adenine1518-N6/adenine1519-N6)-dimethyltransferase
MAALPDYDSPLALKAYLDASDMAMQKKFGQNFLVNGRSRERLVDALDIAEGTSVWEIGPGLGAMTHDILERGAKLTAFEIDRGFCAALKGFFGDRPNFALVEGDVLKNWKRVFAEQGVPNRLFGNLPYNIAATIIADMISEGARFDRVVITIQKEVALRMQASPGTEDYSSFSALCQWAYDVSPLMDLASGCFWPRPNVASRAVVLTKKKEWPVCSSPEIFMSLLRGLFSSRRKTIKNNFSAWAASSGRIPTDLADEGNLRTILERASVDPAARAETLSIAAFIRLADEVAKL